MIVAAKKGTGNQLSDCAGALIALQHSHSAFGLTTLASTESGPDASAL